ncbi:hypothetical protein [Thiohalocapsa marina]|uniref:hypothetical protein n=1 Tax=Thiohalocapsa marina TaxID=424902 RepID=UPI0036DCFF96
MAKRKIQPRQYPEPNKSVEHVTDPSASDEELHKGYARLASSPDLAAWRIIEASERKSGIGANIDVPAMMAALREQAAAVKAGDMGQAEAMLINQATALQTLFGRLAERAMGNDGLAAFEANMRLALRAQNQCRATLETLSAIKNPPVVYARQANIGYNQQVNNGTPHTRGPESEQTQLSGGERELLPHTRAQSIEGRTDTALEAVGAVNRT